MKLTTATNRNQCVPDRKTGEAQAMHTMPNTWQQTDRQSINCTAHFSLDVLEHQYQEFRPLGMTHLVLPFRPFQTVFNEWGWDHVAGSSPANAQITVSSAQLCLSLSNSLSCSHILLQINCHVMRVWRSLYYIYCWYLASSGNNKNVFRCSWQFYLIPGTSVSVAVRYSPPPPPPVSPRHTCNYDLTPRHWPTVAPCWTLNVHTT
jgi:hypothetical protein